MGYSNESRSYTNTFSESSLTADDLIASFRECEAKMDEIHRRHLRTASELVEETICWVCGRKPTVIKRGFVETVVVCQHIYDALKEHCGTKQSLRSPLNSIQIEVFDDGPRRF